MKTEVVLYRPFGDAQVRQMSKCGFLCATDITEIYNVIRVAEGKAAKQMQDYFGNVETQTFLGALCEELNGSKISSAPYVLAFMSGQIVTEVLLKNKKRACRTKVYFVEASNGLIKIGVTSNVKKRLETLQGGSPLKLTLLGFVEGDALQERRIHQELCKTRVHGEWFRRSRKLITAIACVRNGGVTTAEGILENLQTKHLSDINKKTVFIKVS